MSFSTKTTGLAKKSIVKLYPHLRKEIQQIQQEILGYAPPSYNGIRTGVQFGKKQLTSVYVNQYYEGVNIDAAARKVRSNKNKAISVLYIRRPTYGIYVLKIFGYPIECFCPFCLVDCFDIIYYRSDHSIPY